MDRHPATRRGTRRRASREGDGLWDWNLRFNRIHYAPGWVALVGCDRHEVGNTPDEWFQRVHPDDIERLRREIDGLRSDGRSGFELRYRLRHKDGTYRWMVSQGLVVRNDLGEAIRLTGSQSDVTVETVTDPITGLPNHLLLRDRLTQSIERARRHETFHFAVLLIDLGRPAGEPAPDAADPLLMAVARRLETCLRGPETTPAQRQYDLVARVEGDLFAILLDGLEDPRHAQVVADRVLDALLGPFTLSGCEVRLTAAIGMAVSATGYVQADDALRDARTALHRANVLGGSHVEVFDIAAVRSTQTDQRLESDLEGALQRREFHLLFQPIVSIAANRIVGFEALVRWEHPALGTISPVEFIPFAERTGFIVPLGNWILREACQYMSAWQAEIPAAGSVWMSVNLSSVQSRHPQLVEEVGQALHESGLPPGSLVLELTEGTAMENPAAVTTLLMQLRAMGIRISIDDFGTGYSSLSYLHQFPVDALKIDRSFVRRLDVDQDTVAIVAGTIAMARQLGLHVVAEGVEDDDQLTALRSLGCDSAQGYLFTQPLDADEAANLLKMGLPARAARRVDEQRTVSQAVDTLWTRLRGAASPAPALLAAVLVLLCAGLVAAFGLGSPTVQEVPDLQPESASESGTTTDEAGPEPGAPPSLTEADAATQTPLAAPLEVQPPPPAPISFDVVHLHRLASCHGRFTVSRDGIEYIPEGSDDNDDAFVLRHGEFFLTVDGSALTIRSMRRTYRFTTGDSTRAEQAATLLRLADTISRARLR